MGGGCLGQCFMVERRSRRMTTMNISRHHTRRYSGRRRRPAEVFVSAAWWSVLGPVRPASNDLVGRRWAINGPLGSVRPAVERAEVSSDASDRGAGATRSLIDRRRCGLERAPTPTQRQRRRRTTTTATTKATTTMVARERRGQQQRQPQRTTTTTTTTTNTSTTMMATTINTTWTTTTTTTTTTTATTTNKNNYNTGYNDNEDQENDGYNNDNNDNDDYNDNCDENNYNNDGNENEDYENDDNDDKNNDKYNDDDDERRRWKLSSSRSSCRCIVWTDLYPGKHHRDHVSLPTPVTHRTVSNDGQYQSSRRYRHYKLDRHCMYTFDKQERTKTDVWIRPLSGTVPL